MTALIAGRVIAAERSADVLGGEAGAFAIATGVTDLERGNGTFGDGSSGETTGRSASSRKPSAAGKSDGNGARSPEVGDAAAAGGGPDGGGATGTALEGCTTASDNSDPSTAMATRAAWGAIPGAAPGWATMNECPHFGQRILRPAGDIRRSSI